MFNLTGLDRSNLYLEVQLFYAPVSVTDVTLFTPMPSLALKPDTSGNVYVYLQLILDSLTTFAVPVPGTVANDAGSQLVKFYVKYREVSDDDPTPDFTSDSDKVRFAMKGGMEKEKFSRNNYLVNVFKVAKPFLTWQPAGKYVFADEPVYCTLFNPAFTSGLKLKIVVTDVTGASATQNTTLAQKYLLHLSTGITANSLAGLVDNPVWYYDVSITDSAGTTTVITARRFYAEYRPVYHRYELVYHNSLGGVDNMRVRADVQRGFDRDFEEAERGLSLTDATDTAKAHETTHTGITLRRHFTGDAGWQYSGLQQESYAELHAATSVYMLLDGRYVPVLLTSKQVSLGWENDKVRSYPLEWVLSHLNETFTPYAQSLGMGNTDDDY